MFGLRDLLAPVLALPPLTVGHNARGSRDWAIGSRPVGTVTHTFGACREPHTVEVPVYRARLIERSRYPAPHAAAKLFDPEGSDGRAVAAAIARRRHRRRRNLRIHGARR